MYIKMLFLVIALSPSISLAQEVPQHFAIDGRVYTGLVWETRTPNASSVMLPGKAFPFGVQGNLHLPLANLEFQVRGGGINFLDRVPANQSVVAFNWAVRVLYKPIPWIAVGVGYEQYLEVFNVSAVATQTQVNHYGEVFLSFQIFRGRKAPLIEPMVRVGDPQSLRPDGSPDRNFSLGLGVNLVAPIMF